jgi:hypothetical protein
MCEAVSREQGMTVGVKCPYLNNDSRPLANTSGGKVNVDWMVPNRGRCVLCLAGVFSFEQGP